MSANAPTRPALVAGIGNIFLGDDGFGVEVARRLLARPPRPGVCIEDFGIRGLDLAYALQKEWAQVILVDAMPRGHEPGTLCVLEPEPGPAAPGATALGAHGIVPEGVLSIARALGGRLPPVRVLGCEPARVPEDGEIEVGLSPAVAAAVDAAVRLVDELLEREAADA